MFHQGFSDIISCLPLVNYYSKSYDHLTVIIREDFKETVEFYLKDVDNLEILYFHIDILRSHLNPFELVSLPYDTDRLFHGTYDNFRNPNDGYFRKFNQSMFYGKGFFEFYGISVREKINNFNLSRDHNREEELYTKVIGNDKSEYVLFHENDINKVKKSTIHKNVDLNRISNNIFDSIKILEKAKEIHIVDSVWSILCYLLDTKYGLFKDKKVYLYPFKERSGSCVWFNDKTKIEPYKPNNWIIV